MAWYRCGANASSGGGNEIALVPEGSFVNSGDINNLSYNTTYSRTTRATFYCFNGKDVAGHNITFTTNGTSTVYFKFFKGTVDNLSLVLEALSLSSGTAVDKLIPNDVELVVILAFSAAGTITVNLKVNP